MKKIIATLTHRLPLSGILLGLACSAPAFAAEDQWYDPTDWFDGNNVESDDTYDGYYDYSYGYDYDRDWNNYGMWGVGNWGADYYDSEYWDNYDWNDSTRTASRSGRANSTSESTGSSSQATKSTNPSDSKSSANDAVVYTYVLFAEPATSQQEGQQKQAGKSQANQSSDQRSQQKQIARLNGTIEGLRQMNLQRRSGATGPHTIAKIKLDNGKTTVVSLGRSSQLSDLDLKAGDKIQAVGRKGMIDGETVFVAHSLRAKGQTIAANPAIRLNRTQASQSQTVQAQNQKQAGGMTGSTTGHAQATLEGEVASISRASAGQGNNQHTLVDIKLENGKTSTVDFGPAASLEKIGVEEGDDITVRGRRATVSGREVIVADLLKVDGEKVSSVSR